jgi:hypothetical protein
MYISHIVKPEKLFEWCSDSNSFMKLKTLNTSGINLRKITLLFKPNIRGLFAKVMDSPYYSELELFGGVVTVSFLKYLPWQVMHFLQCSTHFSKTCCRPLITSKFLASELSFHGWKSPEIAWGKI